MCGLVNGFNVFLRGINSKPDNRELKIEVLRHFPRIANVRKSRDQGLAVRFAV